MFGDVLRRYYSRIPADNRQKDSESGLEINRGTLFRDTGLGVELVKFKRILWVESTVEEFRVKFDPNVVHFLPELNHF